MNLFGKLFLSGHWEIGIRKNNWAWPFDYTTPFEKLKGVKGYWYADSLMFESCGNHYLFCEAFNMKEQKGEIAVSVHENDEWTVPQVIISNNYHMSYPCVFSYKEKVYMIPESQENNTLELYAASEFPFKWERIAILMKGEKYADATVFEQDSMLYIYAYKSSKKLGVVFSLDVEGRTATIIKEIPFSQNTGRPAGKIIKMKDFFIRPSQDCRNTYGERVLWNKLVLNAGGIEEFLIDELNNSSVSIADQRGVNKIHTFSIDGLYEAIDYYNYSFDLYKRFKILWMHYKKRKRQIIGR